MCLGPEAIPSSYPHVALISTRRLLSSVVFFSSRFCVFFMFNFVFSNVFTNFFYQI